MRSDSSLMGLAYSAEHAVETLLSGPAASALGGSALTGRDNAVVVDIGGTTTDVALIENSAPLLADGGIRVGQWKTLVKGLFSTSFALGGDSAIRWDKDGALTLGPDRIIPLCVLAEQYPGILPVLRSQVREVPAHTLPLHEFLTLGRADWHHLPIGESDRRLCRALEKGPLSLQQAADAVGVDKYLLHTGLLEKAGVILRAGLTPTDVMHVRGDYPRYDREAAQLAVQFAANSLRMLPEEFCDRIYDDVSREVFYGVSQLLLEHSSPYFRRHGLDDGMRELLRLQWENRHTGGDSLLHYAFRAPAALVGIGGPVHLFLPEAAKALGAECIIPDCAPTANAVGAVTGRMSASAEAEVRPHGLSPDDSVQGDWEVLCDGQPPRYFADEAEAAAWAEARLRERTEKSLRAQGATGELSFVSRVNDMTADILVGGVKLCTRIRVTASNLPDANCCKGEPTCVN